MKGFRQLFFSLLLICLTNIAFASGGELAFNDNGYTYHPIKGKPIPSYNIWGFAQGQSLNISKNNFKLKNQVFLHALFLEFHADFNKDVSYNISAYFLRQPMIETAYFQYSGWSHTIIQVGQIFANFGLNNTDSKGELNFIEYNLPSSAFSTPYSAGGDVTFYNHQFSAFFAAFGPRMSVNYKQPYPFGLDTRDIWSPIHNDNQMFETGFSVWYQQPDGSNTGSVGTVPEFDTRNSIQLINTGTIINIGHSMAYDAEIAYQWHSFSVIGEYVLNRISRMKTSPNLNFSGYYVSLSYFLTGEHHPYSFPGADFSDVSKIKHRFGALELATRLSNTNLNSRDTLGGRETNATLGFNWYFSSHLKIMINYIRIFYRNGPTHKNHIYNAVAAQLQATL